MILNNDNCSSTESDFEENKDLTSVPNLTLPVACSRVNEDSSKSLKSKVESNYNLRSFG